MNPFKKIVVEQVEKREEDIKKHIKLWHKTQFRYLQFYLKNEISEKGATMTYFYLPSSSVNILSNFEDYQYISILDRENLPDEIKKFLEV